MGKRSGCSKKSPWARTFLQNPLQQCLKTNRIPCTDTRENQGHTDGKNDQRRQEQLDQRGSIFIHPCHLLPASRLTTALNL